MTHLQYEDGEQHKCTITQLLLGETLLLSLVVRCTSDYFLTCGTSLFCLFVCSSSRFYIQQSWAKGSRRRALERPSESDDSVTGLRPTSLKNTHACRHQPTPELVRHAWDITLSPLSFKNTPFFFGVEGG